MDTWIIRKKKLVGGHFKSIIWSSIKYNQLQFMSNQEPYGPSTTVNHRQPPSTTNHCVQYWPDPFSSKLENPTQIGWDWIFNWLMRLNILQNNFYVPSPKSLVDVGSWFDEVSRWKAVWLLKVLINIIINYIKNFCSFGVGYVSIIPLLPRLFRSESKILCFASVGCVVLIRF